MNCARKRDSSKSSPASVRESHPHDIAITQEAPNYTAEFKTADGG